MALYSVQWRDQIFVKGHGLCLLLEKCVKI